MATRRDEVCVPCCQAHLFRRTGPGRAGCPRVTRFQLLSLTPCQRGTQRTSSGCWRTQRMGRYRARVSHEEELMSRSSVTVISSSSASCVYREPVVVHWGVYCWHVGKRLMWHAGIAGSLHDQAGFLNVLCRRFLTVRSAFQCLFWYR